MTESFDPIKCIEDIEAIIPEFEQMAKDIQAKNYEKVIKDAEILIPETEKAIQDCKNST